jgi:hypothetical protein
MQVYDLNDKNDQVFAFEVNNTSLGRSVVVEIIQALHNVKIISRPKALSWLREDVFCEFEVAGCLFQVLEPFGDSSRYWIGPKDNQRHPQIDTIRELFLRT